MKRTTIFLPDEVHAALRREAFEAHMSMAELIRSRLRPRKAAVRRNTEDPLLKAAGICRGEVFSKKIDEQLYGA